jgi:hypothetical protein
MANNNNWEKWLLVITIPVLVFISVIIVMSALYLPFLYIEDPDLRYFAIFVTSTVLIICSCASAVASWVVLTEYLFNIKLFPIIDHFV